MEKQRDKAAKRAQRKIARLEEPADTIETDADALPPSTDESEKLSE